jgi:haloalkane dehalogenase
VTEAFRTPDERFGEITGFPYGPRYEELDGLRIARVDEGDGRPVVFFHGEPTWSYLWRKVIPTVLEAGHRCIAPDLAGFGRSDKPLDLGWYTYDRHTDLMASLFDELDISGATAVVHDWGGPIGLRVVVENRERFDRIVIMDSGLFTGRQRMSDAWNMFRDFVARTEDLPVSLLVRRACLTDPGDEVAAAYDAPFPTPESKAGPRSFPLILPTSPDMAGAEAGERVARALRADGRPMLCLWADSDPILSPETGRRFAAAIGAPEPEIIEGASHFLQEDRGIEIGERIAAWLDV